MTQKKTQWPLWLIKLFTYEYWTWWAFYLPLIPYWLYQAFRTKSLTFFTNADPCIDYGGFFGESKIDILKQIPAQYLPQTVFITQGCSFEFVLEQIKTLEYPLICKPNVGERGTEVEKITDEKALKNYFDSHPIDFIIQEYIDYDIELGVLYYRMPQEEKGYVSHSAFGNTHQYYPAVSIEDYRKGFMSTAIDNYFNSSYKSMVSFFAKEEKISAAELREILDAIENPKEEK